MRKIGRTELDNLLDHSVCEIVFVRRRPERAPGRSTVRRMICSNWLDVLNSENGIRSLNYRREGPKQINEALHNVVVAWDIFMQDYRNISIEGCYLVESIDTPEEFWKFFNNTLLPMSPQQKLLYMDNE